MQPSLFGPTSGARLSPCGSYRWTLWRRVGEGPILNWIMLNPSTATAEEDDPTIRRCLAFARTLGYGTLTVTNLFGLRATDPRDLKKALDPVGGLNDHYLREEARDADRVLCAWGNGGTYRDRSRVVRRLLREAGVTPYVLRLTGAGEPSHPLYLPGDLVPVVWEGGC